MSLVSRKKFSCFPVLLLDQRDGKENMLSAADGERLQAAVLNDVIRDTEQYLLDQGWSPEEARVQMTELQAIARRVFAAREPTTGSTSPTPALPAMASAVASASGPAATPAAAAAAALPLASGSEAPLGPDDDGSDDDDSMYEPPTFLDGHYTDQRVGSGKDGWRLTVKFHNCLLEYRGQLYVIRHADGVFGR